MARSITSLTKYTSAVTIVTADVANSWFGGLYGSAEAAALSADDPRVIGHVHDGQKLDGHAQKIDLVDHVTNQLLNANLADDAVTVRNVRGFATQSSAIPESELIGGTTYYYLDLSDIRADIAALDLGEDNVGANVGGATGTLYRDKVGETLNFKTIAAGTDISVTNNADTISIGFTGSTSRAFILDTGVVRENVSGSGSYATDDFVFGSPSLEDTGDVNNDNRILFDKSKGAIRAGIATGTEFNDSNRGTGSVAFGDRNIASSTDSGALSGQTNTSAGQQSVIAGGLNNSTTSNRSAILGGESNQATSNNATVGGGGSNTVDDQYGTIMGGFSNEVHGAYSTVGGGRDNDIDETGPQTNEYSGIFAGQGNQITTASSDSDHSIIGGGQNNQIADSTLSVVVGGSGNTVTAGSYNSILGGQSNTIIENSNTTLSPSHISISSGLTNTVFNGDYISGATVSNAGTGYAPFDILTISGGVGEPVQITPLTFTSGPPGPIATFEIINAGNYSTNPSSPASVTGGSGSGATFNLTFARSGNAQYAFVGSGQNGIIGSSIGATIGAGRSNEIYSAAYAGIFAGFNNVISGSGSPDPEGLGAEHSVIVGGENNSINADRTDPSANSFIGSGNGNLIIGSGSSAIVSGNNNSISQTFTTTVPVLFGFIGSGSGNYIWGNTGAASILNGISNVVQAGSDYSSILNGDSNSIGTSHTVLFGLENEQVSGGAEHIFGMGYKGYSPNSYSMFISADPFVSGNSQNGQAQYTVIVGSAIINSTALTEIVRSGLGGNGSDDFGAMITVDWVAYRISGGTERTSAGTYAAHVYDSNGSGTFSVTNIAGLTAQNNVGLAGSITPSITTSGDNAIFNLQFSNSDDYISHVTATMKVTKSWYSG